MKIFQDYLDEINEFFRSQGVSVDPIPLVKVDYRDNKVYDPFIDTANYDPETKTITIFVTNRQLKDILRSYCHELAHHSQNLTMGDDFKRISKLGKLSENDELSKLEEDAYRNGNILFRKWTESGK